MVADKSKFDRVLVDQPQCEDFSKSNSILDTSPASSSDESLKSKSENEKRSDESLDSSDKNESGDDDRKIFNSTYSCSKPTLVNDDEIDHEAVKDEQHQTLIHLKAAEDSLMEWKHSWTSYKGITQWSDLKLETLSMEDLLTSKEIDDDSVLMRIRNYLVDYQAVRGTSREEYTFSTLIRVMGQATGRCLFALFYVILNISPAVLEIFLHIVRFVLDKTIDIKDAENAQQMIIKTTIFAAQVVCIYICLVFIFGFIVLPVIRMAFGIFTKIMLYD